MTACKVLRCTADATTHVLPEPDYEAFKIPLCQEHGRAIADGDAWMMDGDMGVPTEGIPTAGYTVLMGRDMPPMVNQHSMARTTGHVPGVKISLQYDTPDGPGSTDYWLNEQQAEWIGEFFKPTPNPDSYGTS